MTVGNRMSGSRVICITENCWYRHDNHITNEKIEGIENSELIQRIFNMMEEFTERITHVENQL